MRCSLKRLIRTALFAGILTVPTVLHAQTYLYTDIGRLKEEARSLWYMNRMHLTPASYYPQDEFDSAQRGGYMPYGVIDSWIDAGSDTPKTNSWYGGIGWFAQWPFPTTNRQFKRILRLRPPAIMLGQDELPVGIPADEEYDPTLPVDQIVVLEGVFPEGWTLTNIHYGLANHHLDRSAIHRFNYNYEGITSESGGTAVTLPPGQVRTFWGGHSWLAEVWRAGRIKVTASGGRAQIYDDFADVMEASSRLLTAGAVPRAANLQVAYTRDGREKDFTATEGALDDTGDPHVGLRFVSERMQETGEFLSDVFYGSALIHIDNSGADKTDRFHPTDLSQSAPATVFYRRYGQGGGNVWKGLSTQARLDLTKGTGFAKSVLRQHFENNGAVTSGTMWTGVTEAAVGSAPFVPVSSQNEWAETCWMMSGPYVLNPGEQWDYVHVYGAANLPRKVNRDLGARYLRWLALNSPAGLHPVGEDAAHAQLVPLSNLEKFEVLNVLTDSLFNVVDQAFYGWHGGVGGGGLTVADKKAGEGLRLMPDPPPSPDILVKGGPNRNEIIAWYPDPSYFDDVDTGVDDFTGWKVYRKKGRDDVNNPQELRDFGLLDWELVGVITHTGVFGPTGETIPGVSLSADHYNVDYQFATGEIRRAMRFYDFGAALNESYYYAVTTFDDGSQNIYGSQPGESLESSYLYNRTSGIATSPFVPGLDVSDEVLVVPNPWTADAGASKYTGIDPNKILFDRLPRICTLKIFTETGDLVYTIEHTDQSGHEFWFQQTSSTQLVKSGIYILAVVNAKKVDPTTGEILENLPDRFVKFIIVR